MFLGLSTIPHISQVSYLGLDGLLFSLYNSEYPQWGSIGLGSQTSAVFSNTTVSESWYTQPVNRDTGLLYGTAVNIDSNSMCTVNASWFRQALNNTSGYTWLGTGCDRAEDRLFFSSVAMNGRGVISLGMKAKVVVDHFSAVDFHKGYFHLATSDGKVIVPAKLPKAQFQIRNKTVSLQTVKSNGDVTDHTFSCHHSSSYSWKIDGVKYTAYCNTLTIVGISSVRMPLYAFVCVSI